MYARRKITFRVIEHHEKHTNASCYINAVISLGNGRYDNRRGNGILYQIEKETTRNGIEPSTSAVTGRRSNQLSHRAIKGIYIPSKPHIENRIEQTSYPLNLLVKPSTD